MLLIERVPGAVGNGEKLTVKLVELAEHPLRRDADAVLAAAGADHAEGESLPVDGSGLDACHGWRRPQSAKSSKRFDSEPTPGIEISIRQPGFIVRAPTEVPQQTRSPGTSVWYSDNMATICCGL